MNPNDEDPRSDFKLAPLFHFLIADVILKAVLYYIRVYLQLLVEALQN